MKDGAETKYTYNKFHLVVKKRQWKGAKQVTQITTYYALKNSTFEEQPPQYQLPQSIHTVHLDTNTQASRTESTEHEYDDWGNATREMQANGIQTERVYYPATCQEPGCPGDPHGFQLHMKAVITTPAASSWSTPTRSTQYTYQAFPTAATAVTD